MSAPDPLPDLLIALPVVIVACRVGAALARRAGQPPVVGEIATGILLGPSVLGLLWPAAQTWLIPPAAIPYTGQLGQLGLLVFMFLIGLELDLGLLRGQGRTAAAVSQTAMLLPLAAGATLGLGMYGTLAPQGVRETPFVLFIAVAMSVTALPVLARILTDHGLHRTRLGALAMACAAVDDVLAWCLLAVVVALSHSASPWDALTTAAFTLCFLLVMVYVVRPVLTRWAAGGEGEAESSDRSARTLTVLFCGLCLAALATDRIGVHALVGAFVFGAVSPRGSREITRSATRLHRITAPLLLPLFFAQTGLRTDIGALGADPAHWWWAVALFATAVATKWGGSALAARLCGGSWPEALRLGALMNCRGLTELVILNVGLDLGVIGRDIFTMLVLMALATTALTSPALSRLGRGPAPQPVRLSQGPPSSSYSTEPTKGTRTG